MKCPQDVDVDLVMSERQGVEIDYCPSCRGVWLDRGELDKILDRAAAQAGPVASAAGHVSGEGGPGPAAGAPSGSEAASGAYGSGYGSTGGYGTGGYGPSGSGSGGHGSAGAGYGGVPGRYGGDDHGRYDDDRDRHRDDRDRYGDDDRRGQRPGHDPRRKRKESWLGDLLDFG